MDISMILEFVDMGATVAIVIFFIRQQERVIQSMIPVLEANIKSSDEKWNVLVKLCQRGEGEMNFLREVIRLIAKDDNLTVEDLHRFVDQLEKKDQKSQE